MRVAVIIPARNSADRLGECLNALRKEGVPGEATQLIVVDDESEDQTARFGAIALITARATVIERASASVPRDVRTTSERHSR